MSITENGPVLDLNSETGQIIGFAMNGRKLNAGNPPDLPVVEIQLLSEDEDFTVFPNITEVAEIECAPPEVKVMKVVFDSCMKDLDGKERYDISGSCRIALDHDGVFRSTMNIVNRSNLQVTSFLFPRTCALDFGETMNLIYPLHAGENIKDLPSALASSRYQEFERASSEPTEYGFARETRYCGMASMTWMDLYSETIGLYVASYDSTFPITGLRVETGGPLNPWVVLSFRKHVSIDPGESYSSAEVVWVIHSGDWHESAKRYRHWFDGYVEQARHPEDLGKEVIMTPHYYFRRHAGIKYRFEDIPLMADRDRLNLRSRHFFIASYNHMGFDAQYPNYNPDLDLGTPLKLQQGVRYINDTDGFSTFYINCRIMDKYSDYMETLGERWLLRNPDNSAIHEVYGPAEAVVLCPNNPEWRNHLMDFATWMVQAYGARGIYYDQLASMPAYSCYGSHEHSPEHGINGFHQGYIRLIEDTTKRLQQIRNDAFLMIENCGDIYSSRVWGSLAADRMFYDDFYQLYKYTFPEQTLINMITPRALEDVEHQEQVFYHELSRAFLLGSVLWLESDAFEANVSQEDRREAMLEAIHEVLDLRYFIAPQLAASTFCDDVGLRLPPGVKGSFWKNGNEALVLLYNEDVHNEGQMTISDESLAANELEVCLDGQTWTKYPSLPSPHGMSLAVPPQRFAALRLRKT